MPCQHTGEASGPMRIHHTCTVTQDLIQNSVRRLHSTTTLPRISRPLRLWIDPEESFHTHCYHFNGLFIGGIIQRTHISDQANTASWEVYYGAKYKNTTCMYSRSQNSPPEGKGFHFMFKVVSRLLFPEESDGADHFLKKRCPTCPFWPIVCPRVGQIKNTLLFDINNIFLINNQQLLCFWISLIHWYHFKNHRKLINVSKSKMAATISKKCNI